MSTTWTVETISDIMFSHNVGIVSYVDFTPINKKPGFGEDIDKVVMSAFIHFSESESNYIRINNKFWDIVNFGGSYKLQVRPTEYWICLKNKNPIQRTLMNIHQVVENGRHLESLITKQDEEIKNLKQSIDGLHHVIYQLIGGLFCHETQKGIIGIHLSELGLPISCENTNNSHKWNILPTTRQGDENSRKIEELERKLNILTARFMEKKIDYENEEMDQELCRRKYKKN